MSDLQPGTEPELRALYEEGLTIREIAAKMNTSQETVRRRMLHAGIPRRPRGKPKGKHLPNGGRTVDKDGYVLVLAPDHPYANSSGYVREHRLIVEQALGRYLLPEERVHHANGVKDDNTPGNLLLFDNDSALKQFALLGNVWSAGDVGNVRRSTRTRRSPERILWELAVLHFCLGRDILRGDLAPPNPSWRAVARAFDTWQEGVAIANRNAYLAGLGDPRLETFGEFATRLFNLPPEP